MSLHNRLRNGLHSWNTVVFAVFLAGTAISLHGRPLELLPVLKSIASGVLGAILFQFTVGNVWGYAVEYRNTGGSVTDRRFLAPFVVAIAAGAVTYAYNATLDAAVWTAFWAFTIMMVLLALGIRFADGYREGAA
ncbi:hypothetical protein C499_02222 [Halogeometricum borinquense DSM 11551]|uniref:Uncharacterized protein n=1 Tax=Halogeometricum borinquense (strain ATCC 700274 / DSM 11551 / JCM 10706 / KCTC 4070 / PR3) TaxID=469382 RepID=E4NPQ2_HALBP|nr:hypothetical protein [Halogeometricum borinquense]ADQ66535.1 hypothetical protein Hbor_09410 [Halogeometricum borinquense DSM 11551]ELY31010.1 hypothetical protein C499_02222 [Halogeometricum borinquense DSM 11551]